MDDNQKSVWQLNQKMLVNNLNIGQTAVSIERYQVRISLNKDQDLVVFPATLPEHTVAEDLPVGLIVETFEVKRSGDDPHSTKLVGLFVDWQACLLVVQGYLAVEELSRWTR